MVCPLIRNQKTEKSHTRKNDHYFHFSRAERHPLHRPKFLRTKRTFRLEACSKDKLNYSSIRKVVEKASISVDNGKFAVFTIILYLIFTVGSSNKSETKICSILFHLDRLFICGPLIPSHRITNCVLQGRPKFSEDLKPINIGNFSYEQ